MVYIKSKVTQNLTRVLNKLPSLICIHENLEMLGTCLGNVQEHVVRSEHPHKGDTMQHGRNILWHCTLEGNSPVTRLQPKMYTILYQYYIKSSN